MRPLLAGIAEDHPRTVLITIEDSGPGIPAELQERIFDAGITTRDTAPSWPGVQHRGLGLTIVRDLIGEAGGITRACSSPGGGARFELELPLTSGMCEIADTCGLVADPAEKGCIECP
jgi:signal transduction histidine kinase